MSVISGKSSQTMLWNSANLSGWLLLSSNREWGRSLPDSAKTPPSSWSSNSNG